LLLGLIWLREGSSKTGASVQAIAGILFFLLVNQAFSCTFGIIFLFPAERLIVLKERASRLYHVGAYFWSKTASELPRTIIVSLIFCIITYFMVELRSGAGYFFAFYAIVLMTTLASEGIAFCVSAIAANPQQAGALAPVFM
jgi:ABC-type multidrug transport system permease subunit